MPPLPASILAALAVCSAARGAAPAVPTLRHVNYLAVRAPKGVPLTGRLRCIDRGPTYADWLRWRLVRPEGYVAARGRVEEGEQGGLAARVEWDGVSVLEVSSGWNAAQVELGDVPHAWRSGVERPLRTVRAWGPLHFWVPEGTAYFNIWLHASVKTEGLHYAIRDPRGDVVREEDGDFDARTKVQIRVPKGQDSAAWSIELTKPRTKGLYIDDVYVELGRHLPPFLAPRPDWARLFAGDWRYDPKAPQPKRRFEATAPKVKPFAGIRSPALDKAYERRGGRDWRTSLPFTYVLDYGSKHLGNPDYAPAVATAPPALLHLGKDVPFNHGWGPIQALGGENQAFGFGEHIARISPEQVRERIAGLRAMVEQLHKAGVRWVAPYVCGMTINGDPERRTGFWGFYDHWDDYRPLGLCPRPDDPVQWLQRTPDGKPRLYYRYNYPEEYYPRFKTNHRLAACWRSDGWRTWLSEVVRFAARCGCDGVFVDNACSQRCQCKLCLAAFREHLSKRYPADQARRLFGDTPLGQMAWPTKEQRYSPLYAEQQRFWCKTVREQLATLKAVGTKALGREFRVFPNGGRPAWIQRAFPDADFVMFEKSIGDYGTHPGMVLSPVFGDLKLRVWNDNIFEHKFVQCLRSRVRPIILSRAGWPRRPPWRMLNPNAARLGMAECAAFSGGGGFLLRPMFGVYHDALNEYRRFFETHPQLYAGLQSYAQVGVLACPEQDWLGNRAHIAAVRELTRVLTEAHVLFDYVSETDFESRVRRVYSTTIAAEMRVVSNACMTALDLGKPLTIVGEFATSKDLADPPLEPKAWKEAIRCATVEAAPQALGADASVLSCPSRELAPHVKVNAFCTPGEGPGRVVVHVVNYNVPLGVEAARPTPVDGIELRLPWPKGRRVAAATAYAPDEQEPVPLETRIEDGRLLCRLPRVRIYRVVEVRCEKAN